MIINGNRLVHFGKIADIKKCFSIRPRPRGRKRLMETPRRHSGFLRNPARRQTFSILSHTTDPAARCRISAPNRIFAAREDKRALVRAASDFVNYFTFFNGLILWIRKEPLRPKNRRVTSAQSFGRIAGS
jgi:hypothetical protein